MPIRSPTNNRVRPANYGSVDIARNAIDHLTPVQRQRAHAAFCVQNYTGVMYSALTSGIRCHCRSMKAAVLSRLNQDGTAKEGFLNEMLTGGESFGIREAGTRRADHIDLNEASPSNAPLVPVFKPSANGVGFVIDEDAFIRKTFSLAQPQVFAGENDVRGPLQFADNSITTTDPMRSPGDNVIGSGTDSFGPHNDVEFEDLPVGSDLGLVDYTSSACPICMGNGYVGGYAVLGAHRLVLSYQHPGADFGAGNLDLTGPVAYIDSKTAVFPVVLPMGCLSVDAFRVWNNLTPVHPTISVDGKVLQAETDILMFCDGRAHTLSVEFAGPARFTHVEIQLRQSTHDAYWSLPEMNRTSARELLDSVDNFQVVFSPMVPLVKPGDVCADSTYGRILYVDSVTGKSNKSRAVLGWNAQVRVVQPQELQSLLPRRSLREQIRSPAFVGGNR